MSSLSAQLHTPELPVRAELRQTIVHVVEYSRFPRRAASEGRRIAYTQDRADTGLGLDLPEALRPNELLNLTLRDIDGYRAIEGLARVVWCREGEGGRFRAGISILREDGERPMMRVRNRLRGGPRNGRTLGSS